MRLARDEERKLRAEKRQKFADDRIEAARETAEVAKEKSDDRRQFNTMIASIPQGYFASGRKKKRKKRESVSLIETHLNDDTESSSSDNRADKKMPAKK